VFHDHNDYGRQLSGHFELTQDRDGLTVLRDDLEMTTRLFLQISIYTGGGIYGSIHTGWYVCSIRNMETTSRNPERRGALVGGKRQLSALTRSIQLQRGGCQLT
jgi:hypothetical protein